MATLGRLLIDIAANTSQLKTDLAEARKELGVFRGSVEGGMAAVGRMGQSLLGLAGGVLTVRALGSAVKSAFVEFAQAERQSLRLEAVIRATGGAVGITAREFKGLAQELERSTLFDDKEVLAAISQLQTFDNITGKTFENAIRLAVDLASVWDGDLSTSAFALGKALQDPASAATVLSRSKLRLTEDEKQAIAAFTRMNDVASAQGVILKALTERVGGVAGNEASGLAGAFHRLKEKIEDAKKAFAGWFVGGVEKIVGFPKNDLWPDRKEVGLPELSGFTNTEGISKEVGGLTTLAGMSRLKSGDIARLREIGRAHAEALRLPNLELEVRVRLARELQAIQEALDSLAPKQHNNLGALLDGSRMGGTAADQAAMQAAVANSRLSSAMTGVGGERGLSPFGQEKQDQAAKLWQESWINAIRGTQEAFTEFFMSIGQEVKGFKDLLVNIARTIQRAFAEMLSQQLVNGLFSGLFKNIAGPGGANAGNLTQAGVGPTNAMSPNVVHVYQSNTMRVDAVDGPSVQRMLDTHGNLFLSKVAQGVADAPQLARYIVAQGSR
jgi:hypothetical protein